MKKEAINIASKSISLLSVNDVKMISVITRLK